MRTKLILLGSAIAAAALPSSFALAAPPPDFETYVGRAMKTFDVPGLAIAIVEPDGVTTRGFGVRKLGQPERVDEATLFEIASNTKAFTAAALAMLVDDGKLKWDDRVEDRLPGFKMYDPYVTREMTIRDLLTHRSGLGLGAGDLLWWPSSQFTREEIVQRLRFIKPATSFRASYAYDNLLYIVAGEVVEAVSGKSWEDFVRERIFQPLQMRDSHPTLAAASANPNRTSPHVRLNGPIYGTGDMEPITAGIGTDNSAPAASINTSARDMAKWIALQLGRGTSGTTRLFSEARSREMWRIETPMPFGAGQGAFASVAPKFQGYGLGWVVRDYKGQKILTHSGALLGQYSRTVLIPEKNVGFSIFSNAEESSTLGAIMYRLLDHYVGAPTTDWVEPSRLAREKEVAEAIATVKARRDTGGSRKVPPLPLASYAGTYRDPWYGDIFVERKSAGLAIRFSKSPALSGALEYVRGETFRTRFTNRAMEDAYITFGLTPAGGVAGAKMEAISPIADFSFDYHDLELTKVPEGTPR